MIETRMGGERSKKFDEPDEIIEFPGIVEQIVEIGDLTVARVVQQPGWRWSKDMRSHVEGQWCEAHHVGVNLSGQQRFVFRDGTTIDVGPGEVYDIPPGHDGYTVGDTPAVMIEWSGPRTFGGLRTRAGNRILTTLVFTDLVESTEALSRMGDMGWRDLLSRHYESSRTILERFGGREIGTTGDGMFATFSATAAAIQCAAEIRSRAARDALRVRAGVHVGEVELVGNDVRGIAVNEAARIVGQAAPDEILVSEAAKTFAETAGLTFEDRGLHELKGIPTPRRLFAYVA
jgi:class 3 adenylate cyclase